MLSGCDVTLQRPWDDTGRVPAPTGPINPTTTSYCRCVAMRGPDSSISLAIISAKPFGVLRMTK